MGKNVTVYLPDETAQKMEKLSEVNWSEICRKAIKDYIETRTLTDLSSIITRLRNERKTDYTRGEILVYEEVAPTLSLKDLEHHATGVDIATIMAESRSQMSAETRINADQANALAATFMRNTLRKFKRTMNASVPEAFSDAYVEGAMSALRDIYSRVKSK